MKHLVLFCFSVMTLFLSAIQQQAISAPPPEAPEGFDYKIPYTRTWVNVLGENGIKKSIRSMIINMQHDGYSRSDIKVTAECRDVGKPLSMNVDQIVLNSQWFKLARDTFRSCGWMKNVVFKVQPIQKSKTELSVYCDNVHICTNSTIGVVPPARGVLSNGNTNYTIDCNGTLYYCNQKPDVIHP